MLGCLRDWLLHGRELIILEERSEAQRGKLVLLLSRGEPAYVKVHNFAALYCVVCTMQNGAEKGVLVWQMLLCKKQKEL